MVVPSLAANGISEQQLETWSHPGAQVLSQSTYASIKTAIQAGEWPSGPPAEVCLQGSYRNATNIRADSDVDVLAVFSDIYLPNIEALTDTDRDRYQRWAVPATYKFESYSADLTTALQSYYGWLRVESKTKCVHVEPDRSNNRLGADVVPCFQYRLYHQFTDGADHDYIEGIAFKPDSVLGSTWIINFPKQHHEYGALKNSDSETMGWFKPTVRMFKNARNRYNEGWFQNVDAPSYFIGGLLSNVPSYLFGDTYRDTFIAVVDWLQRTLAEPSAASTFLCQNQLVKLFGDDPAQWSLVKARAFIDAMVTLWEDW